MINLKFWNVYIDVYCISIIIILFVFKNLWKKWYVNLCCKWMKKNILNSIERGNNLLKLSRKKLKGVINLVIYLFKDSV